MSDIYKIDVDTSTGAQLPAQARAEIISAVNGTCGPLIQWIEFDGICAKVRKTDTDPEVLRGDAETLIYRLTGTGWKAEYSISQEEIDGDRQVLNITATWTGRAKEAV